MADYKSDKIKPAWKLPFECDSWPMAVAFARGRRRVIAGNQDGVLVEWELPESPEQGKTTDESGKEADGIVAPPPSRQFVGHANFISHLKVCNDGNTLVSASYDRNVCLWDLSGKASGEAEIVLDRETRARAARRVEEKKRAEILEAPGATVGTVRPAATLGGHKDWINALHLSRNGERVISGDDTGLVIVWDLKARKKVSEWQAPGVGWVSAAALSPDGKLAVVTQFRRSGGSYNNYPSGVRIYNADDGSLKLDVLAVLYPKEDNPPYQYRYEYSKFVAEGLVAADWSPDGKLIALGQGGEGGDGKVHLIEAETGKVVRAVSGHRYGVTAVQFTKDGKHLFTAGRDTTVRVVKVGDGKEVAQMGKARGGQFTDWISGFSLSEDEKWLAGADISGHVQVWELG